MRRELDITEVDAFGYIVQFLRGDRNVRFSSYGYDMYLPGVMHRYLIDVHGYVDDDAMASRESISPAFYAASWALCRRGILRPGVRRLGLQSTDDGSAGNGYSVTPFGESWLKESDRDDYVPSEPDRLAKVLSDAGVRFGSGYQQRAQEAIRCYGAHAYYACCAMCGAAAESLILALAIAKRGDETGVMKDYASAGGRGRVESTIISQQPKGLQEEFRGCSSLLKYWRDHSAHGHSTDISDNEAYTSLALLLRLSLLASGRWDDLTNKP